MKAIKKMLAIIATGYAVWLILLSGEELLDNSATILKTTFRFIGSII